MTTKALFVKLEAKPGKENEVAKFLRDGQGAPENRWPCCPRRWYCFETRLAPFPCFGSRWCW